MSDEVKGKDEQALTDSLVQGGADTPSADVQAPQAPALKLVTPVGEVAVDTPTPALPLVEVELSKRAMAAWGPQLERYKLALEQGGMKSAGVGLYVKLAKNFSSWVAARGLTPETVTTEARDLYLKELGEGGSGRVKQNIGRKVATALTEGKFDMGKPPKFDEEIEEQGQEEEGGEEEEAPEEEEQPRRTSRRAEAPPRVVYVAAPAPRGRPPGSRDSYPRNQPQRASPFGGTKSVLPRSPRLRLYKRSGGQRVYIGDIDAADLGGSVHEYLRSEIDPEHGEADGRTTYMVYELDSNNNERGTPVSITIEVPVENPQQSNDPFQTVRRGLEFMNEFRQLQAEQTAPQSEVLQEAKRKAAAGSDMNSLMMLMMMERMMGSAKPNDEVLIKLINELKPQQQTNQLANLPPMPPMPQMMMAPPPPPPPPQDDTMKTLVAKLVERSLEPPKPQPDFLQQMMLMKQLGLLGGNEAPSSMEQKLAAIEARIAQASASGIGGLEGYVSMFEKMRDMVKTLAPQVNAGGFMGAVQGFLTPELTRVVGNVIAGGIAQATAPRQPAPQIPAHVQVQQPSPIAPAQLPAAPPSNPLIDNAVAQVRAAVGETAQVNATVDLLLAFYNDPRFNPQIETASQAMLKGDLGPAKAALTQILQQARVDLANDAFVTKTLHEVIRRLGGTPPKEEVKAEDPKVEEVPAAEPLPPTVTVGGAAAEHANGAVNGTATPAATAGVNIPAPVTAVS